MNDMYGWGVVQIEICGDTSMDTYTKKYIDNLDRITSWIGYIEKLQDGRGGKRKRHKIFWQAQ